MSESSPIQVPPSSFFEAASELGIEFDSHELELLGVWLSSLEEANQRMNLTRITGPEAAWHRHVLDSLSLLPILHSIEPGSLLDVGSGGGAPGIPLAITLPNMRVGLVDSVGKKARFLEEVVKRLGLSSVQVFNDRAEQLAALGSPQRESWDVVCARAVGRLPVLLELTIPFLRDGGLLLRSRVHRRSRRSTTHVAHCMRSIRE